MKANKRPHPLNILLITLIANTFAIFAGAQPKPGDFVVAFSSAICTPVINTLGAYDPATGALTTLARLQNDVITDLTTAADNRSVLVLTLERLYRRAPNGILTTVAHLRTLGIARGTSVAIDTDGTLLVGGVTVVGTRPAVIRITSFGFTRVWSAPAASIQGAHVMVDQDTAALIITCSSGTYSVDRASQSPRQVSNVARRALSFEASSGRYVMVGSTGLVILDKSAAVVGGITALGAQAVQVDPLH